MADESCIRVHVNHTFVLKRTSLKFLIKVRTNLNRNVYQPKFRNSLIERVEFVWV